MASAVAKEAEVMEKEDNKKGRVEMARVRSQVHKLLSLAFIYPDEEFFTLLTKGSFIEELKNYFSYLTLNTPGDGIMEKGEVALENLDALEGLVKKEFQGQDFPYLQEKYTVVFGHTVNKEYPPVETHYGSEHVYMKIQELGDISGFYNAFGFERSDKAKESFDHISLELELMYVLAAKEGHALDKNHDSEKVATCVAAQKKFVKQHIGMWGPLFATLLEQKSPDEFYQRIAAILGVFLEMEAANLKVRPNKLKVPESASGSLDGTLESDAPSCEMECGMGDGDKVSDLMK